MNEQDRWLDEMVAVGKTNHREKKEEKKKSGVCFCFLTSCRFIFCFFIFLIWYCSIFRLCLLFILFYFLFFFNAFFFFFLSSSFLLFCFIILWKNNQGKKKTKLKKKEKEMFRFCLSQPNFSLGLYTTSIILKLTPIFAISPKILKKTS